MDAYGQRYSRTHGEFVQRTHQGAKWDSRGECAQKTCDEARVSSKEPTQRTCEGASYSELKEPMRSLERGQRTNKRVQRGLKRPMREPRELKEPMRKPRDSLEDPQGSGSLARAQRDDPLESLEIVQRSHGGTQSKLREPMKKPSEGLKDPYQSLVVLMKFY